MKVLDRRHQPLCLRDPKEESGEPAVQQPPLGLTRHRRQRHAVAERRQDECPDLRLDLRMRFGDGAEGMVGGGGAGKAKHPAEQVGDRAVGPVRSIQRASGAGDPRAARPGVPQELVNQSALSQARFSDHRHESAAFRERAFERAGECGHLRVAADERHAQDPVGTLCGAADEPPRDERRALALGDDGRMGLVHELPGSAAVGRVTDEDLTRLRRLLQPCGDVHRVPEHAKLAFPVADRPRDRDPGVQSDPQGKAEPRAFGARAVRSFERGDDVQGRPLRLLGMIDADGPDRPEHGDDRVADVLLDQPAVRPDLVGDHIPGGTHEVMKLGRSESFGEGGEPRDIREQHRDLAGLAASWGLDRESCAAFTAIVEAGRHLGRATWAGDCQGDAALAAKAHALGVPVAAGSTQHGPTRVIRRRPAGVSGPTLLLLTLRNSLTLRA